MKSLGCLLLLLAVSAASAADWKLVWSDEFDKPGLPDPALWSYEKGFVRNHEKQYYTEARKENAHVENGTLIIEARKEDYRDAHYTSASLTTRDKASWTYGRIEMRAKLPTGRGIWPAFWMLGINEREVGWPACGEIDIMELVGFHPEFVEAHCHMPGTSEGQATGSRTHVDRPWEDFHVYAAEWYSDRIDFFLDDHKYFTFKKTEVDAEAWAFDKPQRIILNLAVGGDWGGQQGIDDSIFPQQYVVDYVRVYRKP
jgi:beta-glucanase (GH16 family)